MFKRQMFKILPIDMGVGVEMVSYLKLFTFRPSPSTSGTPDQSINVYDMVILRYELIKVIALFAFSVKFSHNAWFRPGCSMTLSDQTSCPRAPKELRVA